MIIYPAIFKKEEEGFFVRFPDLMGCLTEGGDFVEAIKQAEEALSGYVASLIDRGIELPFPTDVHSLKVNSENECVAIIYFNSDTVSSKNRKIKKTLSIPSWLNELAEREHLNYSYILEEALKKQLNI